MVRKWKKDTWFFSSLSYLLVVFVLWRHHFIGLESGFFFLFFLAFELASVRIFSSSNSAKRAAAVKDYLVQNGVDASRLDSKGFGEDNPIDTNKSRAGRANNRRVEIKVTNE